MKPIIKTLKLGKVEYYNTHLSIINSVLPVKLTPKEIEVLALFMSLDFKVERFGTSARKIVRQELDISHQGLSNYLKSLTMKGFLIEKEGDYEILPILFPAKDQQSYMLKLINLQWES